MPAHCSTLPQYECDPNGFFWRDVYPIPNAILRVLRFVAAPAVRFETLFSQRTISWYRDRYRKHVGSFFARDRAVAEYRAENQARRHSSHGRSPGHHQPQQNANPGLAKRIPLKNTRLDPRPDWQNLVCYATLGGTHTPVKVPDRRPSARLFQSPLSAH